MLRLFNSQSLPDSLRYRLISIYISLNRSGRDTFHNGSVKCGDSISRLKSRMPFGGATEALKLLLYIYTHKRPRFWTTKTVSSGWIKRGGGRRAEWQPSLPRSRYGTQALCSALREESFLTLFLEFYNLVFSCEVLGIWDCYACFLGRRKGSSRRHVYTWVGWMAGWVQDAQHALALDGFRNTADMWQMSHLGV